MAKKKKQETRHQFVVRMRVTFNTHVTVEASDVDEARALAADCKWIDDGMAGAELIDWESNSEPELCS